MKPLNECVLREVHPLPKVDETLAQLSGAKIFSKLDTNSGFLQIPLAKKSQNLTIHLYHTFRPMLCLRFLGKTNQLGKFSQNLAVDKTPPGTIEQELHMDMGMKSNGSLYQGKRGASTTNGPGIV